MNELEPGVHLHLDQLGAGAAPELEQRLWTAPRTWTAGEVVTASIMNLHVRDNLFFLDNQPSVRTSHSVNQSIGNATVTGIAFNTELYDNWGSHDNATNNSRHVAQMAGKYECTACAAWGANPGNTYIQLHRSATQVFAMSEVLAGDYRTMNVSGEVALAVGDYVEVVVIQVSGGALNILAIADYTPRFTMRRLAA